MRLDPSVPTPSVRVPSSVEAAPMAGWRYRWARAYRDGELICDRVDLTIRPDARLGLAPRERRQVIARFVEHLAPTFRDELERLVRRRGAAAGRIADRIGPIELVFDDPKGERRRVVGCLEPPQSRRWGPADNEFVIRERS